MLADQDFRAEGFVVQWDESRALPRKVVNATLSDEYRGKVAGLAGSWVRLTAVDDEIHGAIWDGTELYSVAPFHEVAPRMDSPPTAIADETTMIYRVSDMQGVDANSGGVADDAGSTPAPAAQYQAMVHELQAAWAADASAAAPGTGTQPTPAASPLS